MAFLSDEIQLACRDLAVKASKLDPTEANTIRNRIATRFELDAVELLESIRPYGSVSIYDSQIWRLLGNLVGEAPFYLLFRYHEDDGVWRISDGQSLVAILGETIGFAFYIASESLDFLAYYDDHDCLIGVGRAADWISRIKLERQK